jgi:hypothetical protein
LCVLVSVVRSLKRKNNIFAWSETSYCNRTFHRILSISYP